MHTGATTKISKLLETVVKGWSLDGRDPLTI